MNSHKASALLRYMGQIRQRIGREITIARRFLAHGQTRTDKPSGAQRRESLRYGARYRFDEKAKVWRIQTAKQTRTPRGRTSNPTALP